MKPFKLTAQEKIFLNRICIRLYGSHQIWHNMLKEGMSIDEITHILVEKTKDAKALKKKLKEKLDATILKED